MQDPGTYEGQKSLDGLRNGVGKYVYPNAYYKKERNEEGGAEGEYPDAYFTYEGQWVNNQKHGQGRFVLGDGSWYEGSFQNGQIQGEGAKTWPSGAVYTGQFQAGEQHGQGKHVGAKYKDGTTYEGAWRHNRRHGHGRLTGKDNAVYEGEFVEHQQTGHGTLTRTTGVTFDGQWLKGERHGKGVMKWPNGTVYDGEWQHNNFEGQGELHARCGDMPLRSYKGVWQEGAPTTGAVTIIWKGAEVPPQQEEPPPQKQPAIPDSKPGEKPGKAGAKAAAKKQPEPPAAGSRPTSATESTDLLLIAGGPMPSFTITCAGADGEAADYESGRMITVSLQRLAQKEVPTDKKKGGKKTPEPEEPEGPPEVLSSVALGEVPTVAGLAAFEGLVLPEDTAATSYDGEYVLAFSDTTPLEHPLLNFEPISAETSPTVPVRVEHREEM